MDASTQVPSDNKRRGRGWRGIANFFSEVIQAKMTYDDHVYLAKLAEQAERYEGKFRCCRHGRGSLTGSKRWLKT
jgi:hypothetical protein